MIILKYIQKYIKKVYKPPKYVFFSQAFLVSILTYAYDKLAHFSCIDKSQRIFFYCVNAVTAFAKPNYSQS
jgi:hypothetical protein